VAADILADWQLIAQKWPFLDLEVALMSGEGCEDKRECLMVITVKDGVPTALGPDYPVFERFGLSLSTEIIAGNSIQPLIDYITVRRDDNSRENSFTVDKIVDMIRLC